MYYDYFGLREAPFSIAPNPEYLYMSDRHREALAHLLYGIRSDGGFILLTGEVGTGKTTVCRCLLAQIPEEVDIAFVLNPKLTAAELLATACDDLGIDYPDDPSIKQLVDALNAYLLAAHQQGRRTVLIIDEAQNLSSDVLEQLRLLTNLETNQRKLLQIILLGQPELLDMLAKPELRQLSQRVTARFHLDALTRPEVHEYIHHRLSVAGARSNFFPARVMDGIFRISGGIPRVVNLVCDRALLGTYAQEQGRVDTATVDKAAQEILGLPPTPGSNRNFVLATAAAVAVFVAITWVALNDASPPPPAVTQAATPAAPAPAPVTEPEPVVEAPASPAPDPITDEAAAPMITTTLVVETLYDEPADLAGHDVEAGAYSDLFTLWGTYVPPESGPDCDTAASLDLACLADLSSLREIENLNRPVIIRVSGSWFTLTAIDDDQVTLIAADREYNLRRSDFVSNWDGWYTLVWRPPVDDAGRVEEGDSGKAVETLSRMLDGGNQQVFDKAMAAAVRKFQLSVGQTPDGIVGARTWIHLNSRQSGDVSPRLKPDAS